MIYTVKDLTSELFRSKSLHMLYKDHPPGRIKCLWCLLILQTIVLYYTDILFYNYFIVLGIWSLTF